MAISRLVRAVDEAAADGRLALAIYLVHGFPSPEVSQAAFELNRMPREDVFGMPADPHIISNSRPR